MESSAAVAAAAGLRRRDFSNQRRRKRRDVTVGHSVNGVNVPRESSRSLFLQLSLHA